MRDELGGQRGSGGVEYACQGLLLRKSDEGFIGSFLHIMLIY